MSGFARDRRGGTVIEYALIAGLVSVVILTTVAQIGNKLFGYLASAFP